jgi:EF hand
MSTMNKTVKIAIATIALGLGVGCHKDSQDASAAGATASLAKPATTTAVPSKPLYAARQAALLKYDANHDGMLDLLEQGRMEADRKARLDLLRARMTAGAIPGDTGNHAAVKGAALRRYDANHNGVLDPAERQHMMTEREAFLGKMKARQLATYDTNHNGKIDVQEQAIIDRRLAEMRTTAK